MAANWYNYLLQRNGATVLQIHSPCLLLGQGTIQCHNTSSNISCCYLLSRSVVLDGRQTSMRGHILLHRLNCCLCFLWDLSAQVSAWLTNFAPVLYILHLLLGQEIIQHHNTSSKYHVLLPIQYQPPCRVTSLASMDSVTWSLWGDCFNIRTTRW